jgi:molecular chaperone IbpA|tara:strand:+ start:307 stop:774 length:468 start_codon:yes stop_codon:yes gene_type:complete
MTRSIVYPRSGFIGFDHIFNQLENIHKHAKDTYPPHNVVKDEELKFIIEVAVAGFRKEHIDIQIKDHVLTITGERPARRDQDLYVHKGISARNWKKSFRLSEYTEVNGADLVDGILTVELEVILPEEKRPRKIEIGSNEENENGKFFKKNRKQLA